MKKLAIIAAFLMTTAHAHAGNSISFEIDGHKVRIEAPKNCSELSCCKPRACCGVGGACVCLAEWQRWRRATWL